MPSRKSAFRCDRPDCQGSSWRRQPPLLREVSRNRLAWEHDERSEGSKREGFQVLYDSREMKFVTCTGETSEPHAFKTVVSLEMSKAHLDALAFVPRLKEALCPHEPARPIAAIFVNITRHLPGGYVRTALHLQRAGIAVKFRGTVSEHVAVVHRAGGVQHFVVWTNADAAPLIPAEVTA